MSPASRAIRLALLALAGAAIGACHNLDFSSRFGSGEIDIFDDLFAVSIVDSQHVVAVGYHGAVYYTEDGGETWHKGEVPTNRLLYSVSMADAQRGWVVGQNGVILRTEDGGKTWVDQPNLKRDEESHLFGVEATSPDHAIAVGAWGSRIFTDDGGKTWQDNSLLVGTDHPQFVWLTIEEQERARRGGKVYEDVTLQDVYCLRGTQKCWLIGEFGYIYHSDDAGRTWARGEILGGVQMEPILMDFDQLEPDEEDIERLTAFAKEIENETHLNVLIDPFVSEKEIARYYREDDPEDLFDVISARLDETKGVLEEAGLMTDRIRMYNKPPWDYEEFIEHDPDFLSRYIDGRRADVPMLKISVIQNPFLFTVRFDTEQAGLIAGLGGVVLRSEDGGRTWTYVEIGLRQALLQYSHDGGLTWAPPTPKQFPSIFTFMRDLRFAPDARKTGFIVGQEGMVLRTQDAGDTWTQVLPPEERRGLGMGF
jgi:photosystem II stability/assembly factor-like uncharacterized protein